MTTPREQAASETSLPAQVEDLSRRLREAEARLREMDDRNRELEQEVAQRGVKLSCARIALARAKMAFDETSRRREEMVQDVAHDLRTPLTSINGAAQNLLDGVAGPLAPSAREYVDIVREHSERLIAAVNWLLEAMRAAGEPIDINPAELDVAELCASVVHGLLPLARERGIRLTIERMPAAAVVDGARIRQVIENMLGNALKFTERGGSVSAAVENVADMVSIRIADTGAGIARDELGKIFQRYYRRPGADHSSGLGLVICSEIVRLHGGEIQVESEPGVGTTFIVQLPRNGEALSAWV